MTIRLAIDGLPLIGRRTGVGHYCHGLIEALAGMPSIDLGVYAVTWRMRPALRQQLPAGAPLISRPMPARPLHAAWDGGLPIPLDWFTGRLDVVHGTNFVVPPARRAARVVTVHDLTPLHFPEMCEAATLAYPRFIRQALDGGAWIQTNSAFVAGEVIEHFGADPARVRAIHPGVPPLPSAEPAPPPGPFARYILAVGTVEPRKDYPGLVGAFDRLAGHRPDLGLVIAGADGWGAEAFVAAVEASPFRSRIRRMDYLSDAELSAVLRGAAVLAYPSRYEGFGFPPLQAMGAGVPVVATAVGAVPEVADPAAVLVPPGDVDGLAGALASVLDDADGAQARREAGRRHAARFSWASCAAAMASLYEEAVGDRPTAVRNRRTPAASRRLTGGA
jgi:glycosyltransferase involved in cell wall biosynthesis